MKFAWALPNTLVGLAMGILVIALGGRLRSTPQALEFTFRDRVGQCGRLARTLPFRGIVFGHVVLAVTAQELASVRAHELVHVAQYERWGPLFIPAYLGSSLWQMLRGRSAYWYNHFEVQARSDARRAR